MKLTVPLLSLALLFSNGVAAIDYYISPTGSDQAAGDISAPWATLGKANTSLFPGDTVYLAPGSYAGTIKPNRTGTISTPIQYKALERRTVTLLGTDYPTSFTTFAIHLANKSYIVIEGVIIKPNEPGHRWVNLNGSDHISIRDVRMHGGGYEASRPFTITNSSNITIESCTISNHLGESGDIGNMIIVAGTDKIRFLGNSISKAGHSPLQFYPEDSTNVVLRGNIFHGEWGRSVELLGVIDALFEHNLITNSYDGGHSADARSKFYVTNGIFRFNKAYDNSSFVLNGNSYQDSLPQRNLRYYNNVFNNNGGGMISFNGLAHRTENIRFFNNAIYDNDLWGDHNQIQSWLGPQRDIQFYNNYIGSEIAKDTGSLVWMDGVNSSNDVIYSTDLNSKYPLQFQNNLTGGAPGFTNPAAAQYSLAPTSQLRAAGVPLTTTTNVGPGSMVEVDDTLPFYDGFGIDGEIGDLITLATERYRIVKVDHVAKTIQLDHPGTWVAGDVLTLAALGDVPDIGPLAYTGDYVEIKASKTKINLNESVQLDLVAQNLTPATVTWDFGDDTIASGTSIVRSFAEEGLKPIRAKVVDDQGDTFYAVIKVEVVGPTPKDLVSTTFGPADTEWWWRWKMYRPTPAAYQIEDDKLGNKVLSVFAPSNGGLMPAKISPDNWDILTYPRISLRYRIKPNTTLTMCVDGYKTALGKRYVCLAKTASAILPTDWIDTANILVDDGRWHAIVLDATGLITAFSTATRIQSFVIQAPNAADVTASQGYWIDDFAISPVPSAATGITGFTIIRR